MPRVRGELQQRFTHFFIDEFQDTDPLQAEILLLLAADDPPATDWRASRPIPGKLFLVGDPKQSIYRFRRADIALYEEVKDAPHRGRRRAASPHRQLPGAALDPVLRQRGLRARQWRAARNAARPAMCRSRRSRAEIEGRPTLVALPVPRPYGDYGRFAKYRDRRVLPAGGRRLHSLADP